MRADNAGNPGRGEARRCCCSRVSSAIARSGRRCSPTLPQSVDCRVCATAMASSLGAMAERVLATAPRRVRAGGPLDGRTGRARDRATGPGAGAAPRAARHRLARAPRRRGRRRRAIRAPRAACAGEGTGNARDGTGMGAADGAPGAAGGRPPDRRDPRHDRTPDAGSLRGADRRAARAPGRRLRAARDSRPDAGALRRQDAWSPVAQHEEMAAMIPGAALAVVDDCGHMAPMERPDAGGRGTARLAANASAVRRPGAPMGELTVRVERVRDEALDVRSFELVPTSAGPLPAFTAGSHVDVHIAPGLVRQYSLCNDPRETGRYRDRGKAGARLARGLAGHARADSRGGPPGHRRAAQQLRALTGSRPAICSSPAGSASRRCSA